MIYAKWEIEGEYKIKNGTKCIADYAFCHYTFSGYFIPEGCHELTSINIPDSVTSIGYRAFYDCSALTSVNIPDSVTSIGRAAFDKTGYVNDEYNWKNNVLYIGNYLIATKKEIEGEYKIKNGTRCIADSAFVGCTGLTSISIPSSVTSIEDYAFGGCTSLTGISIPNSVISIGVHAFDGCTGLTSISLPDSVTNIGDYTFQSCSSLTSIDIPDSVTSIGDAAFVYCSSLTSISLPDSVTSISYCAFASCTGLTSISLPDSVTSIGDYAFDGCTGLTSISLPDSVTSISYYAFKSCIGLTSISFPNSVTSIDQSAFEGCTGLTSISLPDSVTSIGAMAFFNCDSLTDVYYSGTESQWEKIDIGYNGHYLLNATIHYNSIMPTPTPEPVKPLKVEPIVPKINTESNTIEIPVTVVEPERAEELNEVELYVAEYDENGRFIGLTLGTKGAVAGDTVTITADIPASDNYKLMLWDGNYVPLTGVMSKIQ